MLVVASDGDGIRRGSGDRGAPSSHGRSPGLAPRRSE